MAEKISLLTPLKTDCPSFTVNTAVNAVNVVDAPAAVNMHGGNEILQTFRNGDNFHILSCGFFLPERFCLYERDDTGGGDGYAEPVMYLQAFRANLGTTVLLNQYGDNGYMKIPFANYELSCGIFIDAAGLIGDAFRIQCQFPVGSFLAGTYMRISMINVPFALNGLVFRVVPFIKVLHTFDLG